METKLGKIQSVSFGLGGYQGCMIGIHVSLEMDGTGVCDTRSAWDANKIKCSERCEWTEEDRNRDYSEIIRYVSDLLEDAKVDYVDQLKGKPVEVIFEGNTLKSWRLLTEVI